MRQASTCSRGTRCGRHPGGSIGGDKRARAAAASEAVLETSSLLEPRRAARLDAPWRESSRPSTRCLHSPLQGGVQGRRSGTGDGWFGRHIRDSDLSSESDLRSPLSAARPLVSASSALEACSCVPRSPCGALKSTAESLRHGVIVGGKELRDVDEPEVMMAPSAVLRHGLMAAEHFKVSTVCGQTRVQGAPNLHTG